MDAYEGWAADPFAAHEARFFVEGRPTKLVRDGTVESFDELPLVPAVETVEAPVVEPVEELVIEPPVWLVADPPVDLPVEAAVEPSVDLPVDAAVEPVMESAVEPVTESAVEPVTESAVEPVGESVLTPAPPGPSLWTPPPPPGVVEPQSADPGEAGPVFGVGLTDTFVGGSGPPPTRRPGRVLVASLVVLVMVVCAAAVVIVGGGKSAEAAVIKSVNSTLADRTAHVSLNMAVQSPSSSVTGTGSGDIDFNQNALQLQLSVAAAGQSVQMQLLYDGGSVYEALPGIGQLAPGKSWISVDLSSLEGPAAAQGPGALGTGANPAATLRLLTQQGNTVVGLGPSTVDGVAVQGYSVSISPATIKAQLASANVPSWLKAALSGVDIEGITNKVYIDNSGLLRRYSMELTETVPPNGTITIDESLDFSDYGTSVSVTPPPPDQVLSLNQFLQALQSAEASGSST